MDFPSKKTVSRLASLLGHERVPAMPQARGRVIKTSIDNKSHICFLLCNRSYRHDKMAAKEAKERLQRPKKDSRRHRKWRPRRHPHFGVLDLALWDILAVTYSNWLTCIAVLKGLDQLCFGGKTVTVWSLHVLKCVWKALKIVLRVRMNECALW